jgi:opacity protein-like surface antigen
MQKVVQAHVIRVGTIVTFLAFISLCVSTSAQDFTHLTLRIGGGFTNPIYHAGSSLNTGFNVDARGGLNLNSMLGADLDFNYSRMNFNDATLAKFGEQNGHEGIWSLTFNPVIHLAPPEAKVRPYVTAGYGLYHLDFQVGHPTTVQTIYCFGFFGCAPTLVGAEDVVASNSTYRSGFNGGAGLDFPIGSGAISLFAEARYSQMFMSRVPDMKIIPVTFGIRF